VTGGQTGEAPRLAVMVSGTGRTLVNLAERIDAGDLNAQIALVIASRECPGADFARERGFTTVVERGVIPQERLEELLSGAGVSWAALAGYVRKVEIPETYRNRIANIHPALLPSFGGEGMYGARVHRAVLDAGCKVSGCTVHLCDERYDAGPIVAQRCCSVLEGDTAETLAARVFELEREVYPEALSMLMSGRAKVEDGRVVIREADARSTR